MASASDSNAENRSEIAALPPRFVDKTALITGVNDRGLGGAIAYRLAREGAHIAAFGLEEPNRTARRIERLGRQLLCVKGDLRQADDLRSFVNQAVERFGGVDVLVNNAGIDLSGPLEDYSDADVQRLFDINLTGAIKLTREVLPHLRQPGGVIVNVASATGLGGNALQSVYSASKAALLGFTHSLAMELLDRKQRVVAIAPGTVLTPMSRRYLGDLSVQGLGSALDRAERTAKALPLGIGMPDDVANAVAFLASDEARWISGITLPIGYCPTYSQPID